MFKFGFLVFIFSLFVDLHAVIYYQHAPYQTSSYEEAKEVSPHSLLLSPQSLEDNEIIKKIESDLHADRDIKPFIDKIQVQSLRGEVTLSGRLESGRLRLYIEKKVKNVRGVKKINNEIELYQTK